MYLPGMRFNDQVWKEVSKLVVKIALPVIQKIGWKRLIDGDQYQTNFVDFFNHLRIELFKSEKDFAKKKENWLGDDVVTLTLDFLNAFEQMPYDVRKLLADESPFRVAIVTKLVAEYANQKNSRPLVLSKYFLSLINRIKKAELKVIETEEKKKNKKNSKTELDWMPTNGMLVKMVSDLASELRDEIDASGFIAYTGKTISANKIRNFRRIDESINEVKTLIVNWTSNKEYVELILDRPIIAEPIEARRLLKGGRCKAAWLLNWSLHHEKFHPSIKGKPARGLFHQAGKSLFDPQMSSEAKEKALADFILELDPINGPYADLVSIYVGGLGILDVLEGIGNQVLDDQEEDSCGNLIVQDYEADNLEETQSDLELDAEELDFDLNGAVEFEDFSSEEIEYSNLIAADPHEDCTDSDANLSSPSKHNVVARDQITKTLSIKKEVTEVESEDYTECIRNYSVPVQAALIIRMVRGSSRDELVQTFRDLKLDTSLGSLSNEELRLWLQEIQGEPIPSFVFENRVKDALDGFLECCKNRLAGIKPECGC